jgi:hypothetical protein
MAATVRRLTFAEFMPAFTNFAARMKLRATLRAFLFPSKASRLAGLRFRDFRGPKPDHPWLIRLLHGTLRMDAAR